MAKLQNKVMKAQEAIEKFVKDGDHLVIGNYTVGTCVKLVFEVIRQQKKGLTLYSQSSVFDVEVLVAGGCVDRLVSTFVYRAGGKEGGSVVERALRAGTLVMEDHTNFQYNARLLAGMHGFSFMQVPEGAIVTDLFKKRSFMGENKYKIIDCPYTGKKILTMRGGEFVDKHDYFTSPGSLEGGDAREKLGLFAPGSGPTMLLTTKGIFHFHEQTREIFLAQVHHGMSVNDIRKDVPWDLKVADNISETERPSDAEIDFVRHFAPSEVVGKKLMYELGMQNAIKQAQARGK